MKGDAVKFSERLRALGFGTYAEYLASEHWSDFRKRYKVAGRRMTCLVCGAKPIQLHHRTYARLGRERFEDVIPVCRPHHEAIHEWLKTSGRNYVEYTHEAVAAMGGECPPPDKKEHRARTAAQKAARKEKRRKRGEAKRIRLAQERARQSAKPLPPAGAWADYLARVAAAEPPPEKPPEKVKAKTAPPPKAKPMWRSSVFRKPRRKSET